MVELLALEVFDQKSRRGNDCKAAVRVLKLEVLAVGVLSLKVELVLVWLGLVMLLMGVVASVLMEEVFEVETKTVEVGSMVLVVGMKVYFQRLRAGMVEYSEVEYFEVGFRQWMMVLPHYLNLEGQAFVE